jgi:hypothetical protein
MFKIHDVDRLKIIAEVHDNARDGEMAAFVEEKMKPRLKFGWVTPSQQSCMMETNKNKRTK